MPKISSTDATSLEFAFIQFRYVNPASTGTSRICLYYTRRSVHPRKNFVYPVVYKHYLNGVSLQNKIKSGIDGGGGGNEPSSGISILRILSKSKLSYDVKYIYSIIVKLWQVISFSGKTGGTVKHHPLS